MGNAEKRRFQKNREQKMIKKSNEGMKRKNHLKEELHSIIKKKENNYTIKFKCMKL